MANTAVIFDIVDLYQKTFGTNPYIIKESGLTTNNEGSKFFIPGFIESAEKEYTKTGSLIKEKYKGIEIFLPIKIYNGPELLMYLPYCTISISGKKTIIETNISGRIGSVKELYNIDDYSINIKGFLIGDDRKFPEKQLEDLRKLHSLQFGVNIDNALTNIFLFQKGLSAAEQQRVVIYDFDLPPVQGGREHVKPFTMSLKSDIMFTLELAE